MRALIFGINGQDGSYLAELLLSEGYEVHGTVRRSSTDSSERLKQVWGRVSVHYCDVTDALAISTLLQAVEPDEIYNLAAMSDVRVSFDLPNYSAHATGIGALNILEAVRQYTPKTRVYQAGSSEMFGKNPVVPCNENSAFEPASPYAAAKVFAYHSACIYRDSYGMFVVNGLLFNHESERRGNEFVTRKISKAVGEIARGRKEKLSLGNLSAKRDWGYAPEYMQAAWLMLRQDVPEDYVVATGESHSVEEFAQKAFSVVGLNWQDYVDHDEHLERPNEVPFLLGDSSKARDRLGWEPKVTFEELVNRMVVNDLCA